MKDATAAHIRVSGRVQGVGYRFFAQAAAESHQLKGWVRNLPGGDVEAEVEGSRVAIERFVEDLRQGPPMSRVEDIQIVWQAPAARFTDFSIR